MQQTIKRSTLFLTGLILGLSLAIGHAVYAKKEESSGLPLEALKEFTDVYHRITTDYVEKPDEKKLLEDAIRGMLSGLDPHSNFLNAEEFKELRVGTTGQFGGLGIEVGMENGFVKVISPIDDTPAKRAGVLAGDLIIKLNDKPVKGMTLSDAVKVMRGKPNTDLLLTIIRKGEDKPLKITITREIIKVKSVKSKMIEEQYGYVRISSFQSRTTQDLLSAIDALKEKNDGHLNGLILDLRNNPGGVLNAAIGVSDAFITDGLIVYTEGRIDDSSHKFTATPSDSINGAPLVVLVNGGSASASEIVAGALQDHKRGIIMGTKTFGKGSVQTIQDLGNGAAVKITTARYFTPSGRSIQALGITPDILQRTTKISSAKKERLGGLKEKDLSRHLSNPNKKNGKADNSAKNEKEAENKKDEPSLAETDFQLYEALNLLKGLNIMSHTK